MSRRRLLVSLAIAVFAAGNPGAAAADSEGGVRFATLPKPGAGFPEGIAADRAGNIYVATFDFTQPNVIYVFRRNGQLEATVSLAGVLPLGLEFDAAGDLYVSDSFGGNVFRIDLPGGAVSTFVADELLRPGSHGFPPFGANGLAFDAAGANLYIANTADDRILKYHVASATLSTFAESVNGADGIAFDARGRLWVAANQADELVALDARGRVVERRGSFDGVGKDGAAKGLLFPASIVLSRGGIYVTNLALALTPAVGDEPEEDVSTYTVSRIPLRDARDSDD